MCYNYRQPALLIFVFITFVALGVLIMQVNYFISYGPMTLGQENGYYMSFAGNSLIVVVCLSSTMLLSAEGRRAYLPCLFNLGFGLASALILASAILFFDNPPETPSMQTYVLHKFIESNENTPLLDRLQDHEDDELGVLGCCGVMGYLDYTVSNHDGSLLNVTHIHVPDTCCVHITPGCGKNLDYPRPHALGDNKIHQKGCLEGGIDNFMKRLDYLTYGFYHYIAYTVLTVLFCALASMASFNILYFCSEGEDVILEGFFRRQKEPNSVVEAADSGDADKVNSTRDIGSTDTVGPGFGDAEDGVLSGTSTGNGAAQH
ncbi:unnamed protein product [Allacma fusca]|uniref:Tetraspanin n=1 Tax=Allacma fusca TaxID=39272 RepID=A0A8J2J3P0_9HEXA|nr:unnamed protein product [Allacma fusca]